ncbi:dihydroorotate dehydrogenase [Candidatus Poribacteria bacterium]|nr:MAG: dihydroorotate dehydrogenase [Candidatus Poribacteria bacterium]
MGEVDLSVEVARIRMKNPVMVASGTFGYGEELADLVDLNKLGAIVVKTITLRPRLGNPPPRIVETPSGMLNSIGLQNVGLEEFVSRKMPFLRKLEIPVIVSIGGERPDDYVQLAQELSGVEGVSGLELNISCPNVKRGGMAIGVDPEETYELVWRVRMVTNLPLIVKLTPNAADVTEIARAAVDAGAEAISLVNTFLAMAVDVERRRPMLSTITGGLSGPAIRPIAVRMVWQVAQSVEVPVIGMGGIMSWRDAMEFLIVGASAVAVGTANLIDPTAPIKVIEGIESYLKRHGFSSVREVIGSLETTPKKRR